MKNNKRNKALIASPYLDHLGGGERYMLSIAKVLSKQLSYDVYYAWDNKSQILKLANKLNISIPDPIMVPSLKNIFFSNNPLLTKRKTSKYDVIFYLSDGSIPYLGGSRNIIHFQVPFHGVGGKSWKNKFKLISINQVIVNSNFTKFSIDQEYSIKSQVIYPPVDLIRPSSKKKYILSVGRFESSLNMKRQDILIDAFDKVSSSLKDWTLILAGAVKDEDLAFLAQLQKRSKGLSIEFHPNADHAVLTKLYQQSTIYWHAAGYGVDESLYPERAEHFGITTVEAMSAGCIPLVVPLGGQKEIVTNKQLQWSHVDDLVKKTQAIIRNLPDALKLLESIDLSKYTKERFAKHIMELLI